MYFKYKNQWYNTSSDALPTNPVFAAGTVFGVLKPASKNGTVLLVNQNNVPTQSGIPSASVFRGPAPVPTIPIGSPTNAPNTGGD
jgi:hypothetical protein